MGILLYFPGLSFPKWQAWVMPPLSAQLETSFQTNSAVGRHLKFLNAGFKICAGDFQIMSNGGHCQPSKCRCFSSLHGLSSEHKLFSRFNVFIRGVYSYIQKKKVTEKALNSLHKDDTEMTKWWLSNYKSSYVIIQLQNHLGWKGTWEVCSPTSCLIWAQK